MPRRLARSRRAVAPAALLLLGSLTAAPGALAQDAFTPKARSTVTEVVSHRFADGSPGNLGYQVATEILEPVAPGESLPTVRIDENEHAQAFEGQWAEQGFHAAWVSRSGTSQFFPDSYTVESAYLDNYVDDGALAPGDRFDMAVKQLSLDSPLTWERKRGDADGELDWDVATKVHRVGGTFGEHSSEMEVMFVRADLVARGGDVDARDGTIDTPPLVIDLPRVYGPDVAVGAASAQFAPYLHYLRNVEGQVVGQSGKAVFTASLTGYLPEAEESTLPGGTTMREWHIPLDIIITATGRTGEVGGRAAMSMPSGGLVKTFGHLGPHSVRAPAASTVITGDGLAPTVETVNAPEPVEPVQSAAPGGSLLDDIEDLAPIDSSLTQPVSVEAAKRSYALTIDPDLYGSGNLGISAARHLRSGRDFLAAAAVPSVEMDGRFITLDRSRLVELRAVPLWDGIRIRFTARSQGNALLDPSSYSRAREGRIYEPGLMLEAVYDLGSGVYAFYTISSVVEGGSYTQLDTRMIIRSLSGEPHSLGATQYVETADVGPFTYNSAPITNEFSDTTRGIVGDGISYGGNATGGGIVTVKRADGTISGQPVADPMMSVEGQRLGLYITSANGAVGDYYGSYLSAGMSGVAASPVYPVPEIGTPCTDPVVVDDSQDDAEAGLDIRRSWFDYDGAHVYATIELESLNEGLLSPARYRMGWRQDHIGYGLQAARSATGDWTYELGLHPSARSQWSRIADATGEVVYGSPGYIRMKAPAQTTLGAQMLDGEMLRDTGAVSYGSTTLGESVSDRAPAGSPELAYGRGRDWTIAPCPGVEIPTTLELLDAPYEVQYTDRLSVRALLSDAAGPVAGQPVTLSFAGAERTVTTDEGGIAQAGFDVDVTPGSHPISADYAGVGGRLPSQAEGEATVLREDSALTVSIEGTGAKRKITATLTDADMVSSGVNGRTVDFYANGEIIGSAPTDESGVASLDAPPRFRGGTHLFEADFAGDDWFWSSHAVST